jgi:cellulose biosynthesis protein BcsQ
MGYVVTVYSSKGGVGKTTLSTNMGASLSHKGYKGAIR